MMLRLSLFLCFSLLGYVRLSLALMTPGKILARQSRYEIYARAVPDTLTTLQKRQNACATDDDPGATECGTDGCCPSSYYCVTASNGDKGCCRRGTTCSGEINGCIPGYEPCSDNLELCCDSNGLTLSGSSTRRTSSTRTSSSTRRSSSARSSTSTRRSSTTSTRTSSSTRRTSSTSSRTSSRTSSSTRQSSTTSSPTELPTDDPSADTRTDTLTTSSTRSLRDPDPTPTTEETTAPNPRATTRAVVTITHTVTAAQSEPSQSSDIIELNAASPLYHGLAKTVLTTLFATILLL